ncbi:MAG: alcohol dehydrogenase [Chloroflexi bacterium]|nr:alcohol dehydrogenase [Chloroflexota bacterium]
MATIQAVVVDPAATGRLSLREVEAPSGRSNEALIRVRATSLNRGEIRGAGTAPDGQRIGWDVAGTIEQPAANGSGPTAGARVVALSFTPPMGWAELVALPTDFIAELPPKVTFAEAATLPVAGLTALLTLEKRGSLLGRRALITGASGGVGHLAVQIARAGGAHVVAVVRRQNAVQMVHDAGAHEVVVSEDASGAAAHGPYDIIVDAVGGPVLSNVLTMVAPRGVVVTYGATAAAETTFDVARFYRAGVPTLAAFQVFPEVSVEAAGVGLRRLAEMVADGRLRPLIQVEGPWTDIGKLAVDLTERRFDGKAVIHIGS